MNRRQPHLAAGARRGATTRSATLVVGGLLLAVVIGAVAFVTLRPPENPAAGRAETPAALNIADLLDPQAESGRGMTIQIADKDDPTRLAAEVLAERYDPDGPMHRRVERPRAWLFGEDGSTWYIEADRGRFFIPEGAETPREGHLEGNVRARRYDPLASGRPRPDETTPTLTATTDEPLRFNLEMLHFETEGRLHVTGPELEFAGRGAYVVLNEQRESISALRVDRGERLVYTPAARAETGERRTAEVYSEAGVEPQAAPATAEMPLAGAGGAALASPTPSGTAETPAGRGNAPAGVAVAPSPRASAPPSARPGPATAPREPKIDTYEILFKDRVRLRSGTRTVAADLLTVWTRLIDNKIPDPAGPGQAYAPAEAAVSAVFAAVPMAPTTPAEIAPATADTFGEATEPVILTWDGPLIVTPIDDDAEALAAGDDVALRFDAAEGRVRFEDEADGAFGLALSADYFAGRERIELSGPGGRVELASPDAGRIIGATKMTIDLPTGYVTVPGPGEMLGRDHDDAPGAPSPQRIRWADAAMFVFGVLDDRMTDRLERASFEGDVFGENRDATLRGSRLDALFGGDPDEDPRLVQLNVADARAEDGRGGLVSGDALEVHFAEGTRGEELDPTRAIITGAALARRENAETIRAGRIDAALGRGDDGDVIVTIAEAEGEVEFDDGDGVSGRGDSLWADALAEQAVISGDGAFVRRDQTTIAGPTIRLDGLGRSARVDGAGSFSHADDAGGRTIETAWTERMEFDDVAGRVECVGGVIATTVAPDRTQDRVDAARIVMTMDPGERGEEDQRDIEQRLIDAVAFGEADQPAVVESRRVAPESPAEAPRVDELFRLEGAEIRFHAADDRLDVPTPGRLFILDRRPDRSTGGTSLAGPGGKRGTSLFTWAGSMTFDRGRGEATFRQAVRAANKPLSDPAVTDVTAESLVARFATTGGRDADPAAAFEGDLLWAEARTGAVLRVEGRREIMADHLLYDAAGRMIQATGESGRRVTVHDLMRGATSTFGAMRWNLASDVIEFMQPGSIVAPE